MTIRDPEILELLRDKSELLALADAVAETQRQPRPRRLRLTAPRLLTVAAVVAAVAIAFLLAPGGGGNHSVIDRALAAIGNGRVLHVVSQSPTGTVFVDLKSGQRTLQTVEYEAWYDQESKRFHFVMRLNGRVGDLLLPDDANKPGVTFSGGIDPAFTALATGYREALASGNATLERTGTLDGRPVYWLRFPSFQRNLPGTEVAIDRRTYKPVLFRTHFSQTRHLDERVLVAETTGFRASDFGRLGPSLLDDLDSISSGSSATDLPPNTRPSVKPPWLTPGTRAAGLKLVAVDPLTVTAHKRVTHGVVLFYGAAPRILPTAGPEPLEIQELPRPDDPAFWKSIPDGSVSIQQGETRGSQGTHRTWTGHVVKHGIYVTITLRAREGEHTVVAIARALKPAS